MLLLIRGHIRTSFDTPELYNFVKILYQIYKVEIYIQTWTVFSNSISWRSVADNPTEVTETIVREYFKEIPIKSILILDDTKITITGNKSGLVIKSGIPLIGWKNMWYGKAALADHVAAKEAHDVIIINTRFDLFCNSNNPAVSILLPFIKNNKDTILPYIVFMSHMATAGIDNFYMATVAVNQHRSQHFTRNLDEILARPEYIHTVHPEKLVFYENMRLGVFRR